NPLGGLSAGVVYPLHENWNCQAGRVQTNRQAIWLQPHNIPAFLNNFLLSRDRSVPALMLADGPALFQAAPELFAYVRAGSPRSAPVYLRAAVHLCYDFLQRRLVGLALVVVLDRAVVAALANFLGAEAMPPCPGVRKYWPGVTLARVGHSGRGYD